MRYTIILTPTAKSDIVNLKLSLEQRFVDIAFIKRELSQIYEKICSLSVFPERYPIYKTNNEIYYFRKMVTKHYIILYSIKNKTVIIKKVLTQGMSI